MACWRQGRSAENILSVSVVTPRWFAAYQAGEDRQKEAAEQKQRGEAAADIDQADEASEQH